MKSVARRGHKKRASQSATAVLNRRASFDYNLTDKIIVGIQLTGRETRAARSSHVGLKGSYVVPKINQHNGKYELFLINSTFTLKNDQPKGSRQSATLTDTSPRKLLATRQQIDKLYNLKSSGSTIVPTKLLTSGHYIKLEIAVGQGKKQYDKRQAIKQREHNRELAKVAKIYRI